MNTQARSSQRLLTGECPVAIDGSKERDTFTLAFVL
jgi:hypothetical protein